MRPYSVRTHRVIGVLVYTLALCAGITVPAQGCPFDALAEDAPPVAGVVRSYTLAEEPASRDHLRTLQKNYSSTFTGRELKLEEYVRRAREFARDDIDTHSITDALPTPTGGKRILKLNTSTGDFLVTDEAGRLILFLRLPVGQRGLGKFKSTADIFEELSVLIPTGSNGGVIPGFTTGEKFTADRFPSQDQADKHFRKHVLGIGPETNLADLARGGTLHREFPKIVESFIREAKKEDLDTVYQRHLDRYVEKAKAFAHDSSPHVLTITNYQPDPVKPGERVLMSYRFNPYTNELLVMNRTRRTIITYHKIDSQNRMAKNYLEALGLPDVRTPFEYFLATATGQPRR